MLNRNLIFYRIDVFLFRIMPCGPLKSHGRKVPIGISGLHVGSQWEMEE